MSVTISKDGCRGCGIYADICPVNVILDNKAVVQENCVACGVCAG